MYARRAGHTRLIVKDYSPTPALSRQKIDNAEKKVYYIGV
jgi:hypothetical protein